MKICYSLVDDTVSSFDCYQPLIHIFGPVMTDNEFYYPYKKSRMKNLITNNFSDRPPFPFKATMCFVIAQSITEEQINYKFAVTFDRTEYQL